MGWFTKSKKKVAKTDAKTDIWSVCPSCKAHIYKEEWDKNLKVCPECSFHDKLTYKERIELLIDNKTFKELNPGIKPTDHLKFFDAKGPYSEKAEAAIKKTGMNESIVTGTGKINGIKTIEAEDFV